MTVWICSYPRSGNSLVAGSLLATGGYRYGQFGEDMTRPDGVERAIAAGALPSSHDGTLILKTHRLSDLIDNARPGDRVIVPIRDGRDVLVSYRHYCGLDVAPDAIAFWEGLKRNRHRWDDWMLSLGELMEQGPWNIGTTILMGLPSVPVEVCRFEGNVERWRQDWRSLQASDPHHFRNGLVGQWRNLPAAEQDYLNNELGPTLERWWYR